jgi:hypothetical protein
MTYQDFSELPIGTIENVRNGNIHYLIVTAVLGTALFCFLGPCSIPLWLICFHFAFCKSCAVIEDLFDPKQPRYWLVGSGYRAELAYSDVNRFRRLHPLITVRP